MRRRPELMRLPVLHLENECFHDCVMCARTRFAPTPWARAAAWLAANGRARMTRLGIGGSEPLAHPAIMRILALARRRGFTGVEVMTSGWPLAGAGLAGRLARLGVEVFSVPLHAPEPEEHDRITGTPGSHRRTLEGIAAARAAGARVFVHANLLRRNIGAVPALERLVVDGLGLPFCVIPVRPKRSNLPYGELAPAYAEMERRLAGRVRTLAGFPLCVAARIQEPALIPSGLISDLLKLYLVDREQHRPAPCRACAARASCLGTFRAHLRLFPGDARLLAPR